MFLFIVIILVAPFFRGVCVGVCVCDFQDNKPLKPGCWPRPPVNYCILIALALKSSHTGSFKVQQIYNFTRLGFDCLIAHKVTSPCMLNETPDQAWLSLSKHQMGPFSFKLCLNWIKLLHYLMWISACSQRTLPIFSDGSRRLEEHYPTQLVLQQQFSQNLQPAVQRWQEEVMFLAPYFRWPAAP